MPIQLMHHDGLMAHLGERLDEIVQVFFRRIAATDQRFDAVLELLRQRAFDENFAAGEFVDDLEAATVELQLGVGLEQFAGGGGWHLDFELHDDETGGVVKHVHERTAPVRFNCGQRRGVQGPPAPARAQIVADHPAVRGIRSRSDVVQASQVHIQ